MGLTLYTATFIAETVRSGIQAVSHGQTEAAQSLGFKDGDRLRLVVVPQAMRVIIPPLTSQYLNLTKNSSLGAAIGYPELVNVFAGTALNQTGRPSRSSRMTMLVYLIFSLTTSALHELVQRPCGAGGKVRGGAMTDTAFVRTQLVQPMGPPPGGVGLMGWLKKNLFSSFGSTVLTVLSVLFLLWLVPALFGFLFQRAVWVGTPDDCRVENVGACWAFISARGTFLIYGPYPTDQYWRVNVFFALSLALLVPLLWPSVPFKRINAVLFFIVYPIVSFFLLHGGVFGLREIPTDQWGGLLVTFLLSVVGITGSLPIGILLALGRQSKLPDHQDLLHRCSSNSGAPCR